MSFSELLKKAISARNLSYSKLEALTGISSSSISHYSNGLREPDIEKIKTLAKALNVPAGYFFGETDIDNKNEPIPAILPEPTVHWGSAPPDAANQQNFTFIPIFESRAAATPAIVEISRDNVDGWVCIPKINHTEDTWHAFKVRGDSMSPYLLENDLAIIQPYTMSPDYLQPDKIYLVHIIDDNGNTGLMLKKAMIKDHYLFLTSENSKYKPLIIDLREINHNPIKGILRRVWREA
ncbi:LexA family transcriptional regulator [Geovibrio sp. ADMFC3]